MPSSVNSNFKLKRNEANEPKKAEYTIIRLKIEKGLKKLNPIPTRPGSMRKASKELRESAKQGFL